jgi:hypothetical protein
MERAKPLLVQMEAFQLWVAGHFGLDESKFAELMAKEASAPFGHYTVKDGTWTTSWRKSLKSLSGLGGHVRRRAGGGC